MLCINNKLAKETQCDKKFTNVGAQIKTNTPTYKQAIRNTFLDLSLGQLLRRDSPRVTICSSKALSTDRTCRYKEVMQYAITANAQQIGNTIKITKYEELF